MKKINIQLRTGDHYIPHEKQELNLPLPQLVTKQRKHIVSYFFSDKAATKGYFFEIISRPSAFGKRRIKMDSVMNEHACKGDLKKKTV